MAESHFTPDYYPSHPIAHHTDDWPDQTWNESDGPYQLTNVWATTDQTDFSKSYSSESYGDQAYFDLDYVPNFYPPHTLQALIDGNQLYLYTHPYQHMSIEGGVDGDPWHYRFSPYAMFRQQQHGVWGGYQSTLSQDAGVGSMTCVFNVRDSEYRVGYGPAYLTPYDMFADGVTPYQLQYRETVSQQALDFVGSATYPLNTNYPQDWGPRGHLSNGDLHIQIFSLLGVHEYTPVEGHDPDYVQPDASFTHDFHVYKIPYTDMDTAIPTSPKIRRDDFDGELLLTIRFHCTIDSNGLPASEWALGYWPPSSHDQMTYEISYPGPQPDAVLMNPEGGQDIVLRGVWSEADLDFQHMDAYNTDRAKWAIVVCSEWEFLRDGDPIQDLGTDIKWTPNDTQHYYLYNHTVIPEIAVYASFEVTMPDFRYWITYTPEILCSPLAPQPFNKKYDFGYVSYPVGGAGHFLTFTVDDTKPDQSIAVLWHAGDPKTPIGRYPMVSQHGEEFWVLHGNDRNLYDDGVVWLLTEHPGSYGEKLAGMVRFQVVGNALTWDYVATLSLHSASQGDYWLQSSEIQWSSHTNDGQEFIIFTDYHQVIAFGATGYEKWRSDTPIVTGAGSTDYWKSQRNTGDVVALPCAGRFVWHNTSPSSLSYVQTLLEGPTYVQNGPGDWTYHFDVTMPVIPTIEAPSNVYVQFAMDINSWYANLMYANIYIDGNFDGVSSPPYYSPNSDTRWWSHTWPWTTDWNSPTHHTIRIQCTTPTQGSFSLLGRPNWTVTVPNPGASGSSTEIRAAEDRVLATRSMEYYESYDGYRASRTGLVRATPQSYWDGVSVNQYGDHIVSPAVGIDGWDFVGDEFNLWPGPIDVVRTPGLTGGSFEWDVFKGRIAVANVMVKPPPVPM
jgi:hypothetical protein